MHKALFFAVAASTACNTSSPAKDVVVEHPDANVAAPASSTLSTHGSSTTSEAGAAHCTTDGDCRTVSSYCKELPCVCRVLAKDEPDPQCGPSSVRCLVDPCLRKAAACQDGRCALVMANSR